MFRIVALLLLLVLCAPARALSIESVELLRDDDGKPGEVVDAFAVGDRTQHFRIQLDGIKLGQHEWLVEFWAEDTEAGSEIRVTDYKDGGRDMNHIDAWVSLPRDWPIGTYRLVLTIGGEPVGTHNYRVGAPAE